MEFSVTEELAALIPMKGTAKRVDLYENLMMMMMQCLNIPITVLAGAVTS
jgi:chorismate mutase